MDKCSESTPNAGVFLNLQVIRFSQNLIKTPNHAEFTRIDFIYQRFEYFSVKPVALKMKILTPLAIRTKTNLFKMSANFGLVKFVRNQLDSQLNFPMRETTIISEFTKLCLFEIFADFCFVFFTELKLCQCVLHVFIFNF